MAHRQNDSLASTVATVRSAITRFSSNKGFNEQNTKASLIVPILQALGWDTGDADEVHWEYRRKPKSDPVDFALLLQRAPCLFLEAKALRECLDDHRMLKQIKINRHIQHPNEASSSTYKINSCGKDFVRATAAAAIRHLFVSGRWYIRTTHAELALIIQGAL